MKVRVSFQGGVAICQSGVCKRQLSGFLTQVTDFGGTNPHPIVPLALGNSQPRLLPHLGNKDLTACASY